MKIRDHGYFIVTESSLTELCVAKSTLTLGFFNLDTRWTEKSLLDDNVELWILFLMRFESSRLDLWVKCYKDFFGSLYYRLEMEPSMVPFDHRWWPLIVDPHHRWVFCLSKSFTAGFAKWQLTHYRYKVKLTLLMGFGYGFWAVELLNWFLFDLGLFPIILYLEWVFWWHGFGLDSS